MTDNNHINLTLDEVLLSKEKVEEFLIVNGYDGLYNSYGCCACIIDDLQPCRESMNSCIPGYKVPCDCGIDSECEFHISSTKDTNITTGYLQKEGDMDNLPETTIATNTQFIEELSKIENKLVSQSEPLGKECDLPLHK